MKTRKHQLDYLSKNTYKSYGFTVVELIIAIVFLIGIGSLFVVQRSTIEAINRDSQRKTAINAMYYDLKEVYFKQNNAYPREINEKNMTAIDPALLKDPDGKSIGDQASQYRYLPSGCNGDVCKGFTLRARLERESDYIRQTDT